MNKEIIRQFTRMQADIIVALDKIGNQEKTWDNTIFIYDKSWEAKNLFMSLSSEERNDVRGYMGFFDSIIDSVREVFITREAHLLSYADQTIDTIKQHEEQREAVQKKLKQQIISLGEGFIDTSLTFISMQQFHEDLKDAAEIALSFVRIMCDIYADEGIDNDNYFSYQHKYNILAKFVGKQNRGYSEEDFRSMGIEELELIDAQIELREKTERMAPFYISYLETFVRKSIKERIAALKLFYDES